MTNQEAIDKIFVTAREKAADEISGLLGTHLKTTKTENRMLSKAGIFKSGHKMVMTTMKVEGELTGESYLLIPLSDAILMGGTLIMLPEAELENHISDEIFGPDETDAFGEIANIIAGVYSASFETLFPKKIRLFKADITVVESAVVDPASDQPITDQLYYISSTAVEMDGRRLGPMQMLLPAELFGLEGEEDTSSPPVTEQPQTVATAASEATEPAAAKEKKVEESAAGGPQEQVNDSLLVVVIAEDSGGREVFADTLQSCGYKAECLGFSEDVKEVIAGCGVRGVFLVFDEVNEQGVASIIKAKTVCGNSAPLIAAGPQWTRNTVLQAVKYGACDIIVTPASEEEIKEKVLVHLGGCQESAAL
jgi:chemotaxis protein CheY-P-specific phosphatase CheC